MFGGNLKALLDNRGKTQKQLADQLRVKQNTVSDWINQGNSPKIEHLCRISDIFGVSVDWLLTGEEHRLPGVPAIIRPLGEDDKDYENPGELEALIAKSGTMVDFESPGENVPKTPYERHILRNFRELTEDQQQELINTSAQMAASIKVQLLRNNADVMSEFASDFHDMPLYDEPSAAGIGSHLSDEASYELIKIPAQEVPARADFLVRIKGDSMEPEFANEDLVFVCKQPTVEVGEVGIFLLDGKSLCKKLTQRRDKYYLHSLNANYEPIELHEHNDLHTFGKVLGKASL